MDELNTFHKTLSNALHSESLRDHTYGFCAFRGDTVDIRGDCLKYSRCGGDSIRLEGAGYSIMVKIKIT